MAEAFKQIGALYVPANVNPNQVGLGCPKCDDHELVPFVSVANGPQSSEPIQRFMRKHAGCGLLEQLEVYGHRLGISGVLDPRPS